MSTTPTLRDAAQALKPCPWCGAGETMLHVNKGTWNGQRYGEPVSVEVRHWCEPEAGQPARMVVRVGRDEESAIAAWNRRTALTQGAGEAVEPVGVEPFGWYTSEYGDVDDIEWNSQRPTYEGDWRPLYCGVRLQQAVRHARENALAPIQQAIRDYHYALDTRQHGGIAQINAFDAICGHLDMDWEQGKEAAIRAKGTHD